MLLFLVRLLFGAAILSYVALRDWKTRTAPDWAWALMGGVGLVVLGIETASQTGDLRTYLILVPMALMLIDLLWERGEGRFERLSAALIYAASALSVVLILARFTTFDEGAQSVLRRGLGVLFVMVLTYLCYYVGLLKGGADAKALISIAFLVPGYPAVLGLPLIPLDPRILGAFEVFFPFALSTLMNAALLLIFLPPYFLLLNVVRGDFRWPQALLGYRVPVDKLPRFAWTLQEAEEGRVRYYAFPSKKVDEAELDGLEELGIKRLWITPQIPFLVPMAIAFVLTFVVGNLLLGLL